MWDAGRDNRLYDRNKTRKARSRHIPRNILRLTKAFKSNTSNSRLSNVSQNNDAIVKVDPRKECTTGTKGKGSQKNATAESRARQIFNPIEEIERLIDSIVLAMSAEQEENDSQSSLNVALSCNYRAERREFRPVLEQNATMRMPPQWLPGFTTPTNISTTFQNSSHLLNFRTTNRSFFCLPLFLHFKATNKSTNAVVDGILMYDAVLTKEEPPPDDPQVFMEVEETEAFLPIEGRSNAFSSGQAERCRFVLKTAKWSATVTYQGKNAPSFFVDDSPGIVPFYIQSQVRSATANTFGLRVADLILSLNVEPTSELTIGDWSRWSRQGTARAPLLPLLTNYTLSASLSNECHSPDYDFEWQLQSTSR